MTDAERIATLEAALRARDRFMVRETIRLNAGGEEVGRTVTCLYCLGRWDHDEPHKHGMDCPCRTHPWRPQVRLFPQ
jgi:hypothetical protein